MAEPDRREKRDLKRYAHVKPAAPWSARCRSEDPRTRRTCTLERRHRGPHIAHDLLRRPRAVWQASAEAAPRSPGSRAPTGARGPDERKSLRPEAAGLPPVLAAAWRRLARLPDHLEEIFLAVLFLAYVWFVVEWAIRVAMGG